MDIKTLIESGKSAKEIAEATGKSLTSVYKYAKTEGLKFTNLKPWNKDDALILEYRRQGKNYHEISRLTGKDKHNIKLTCIRLGVPVDVLNTEADRKKRTQNVIDMCAAQGFEYVSGFVNYKSTIRIRCKSCGNVFDRCYNSLYEKTATCPVCEQKERDRINRIKAEEREAQKQTKAEQRKIEQFARGNPLQTFMRECIKCGSLFIGNGKYCSVRCRERANDSTKSHVRRMRIVSRRHDTNITLLQVYQRDNGICYLCGKKCDWNDCKEDGDMFIAGNNYPSIDHVLALASGGTHEWGNVRLAHRYCNSIKSNT